jgi:hypothetical protein
MNGWTDGVQHIFLRSNSETGATEAKAQAQGDIITLSGYLAFYDAFTFKDCRFDLNADYMIRTFADIDHDCTHTGNYFDLGNVAAWGWGVTTAGITVKWENSTFHNIGSEFQAYSSESNSSAHEYWNCAIDGGRFLTGGDNRGIYVYNSNLDQMTAADFYTGTVILVDHCASGDAADADLTTDTNNNWSVASWSSMFTDLSGGDYTLTASADSNIIDHALGTSGGAPSLDANGVSRDTGSSDCGPFEYVSPATINYFHQRKIAGINDRFNPNLKR